jgi:2-iminobutanoate/2-iminopropanoate deaminase
MDKQCLNSERLAPAVGPYSQAVRVGQWLFCSGVIPVDPETKKIVEGDIAVQARRVLDNITILLEDCGTGLGNVVKTTVFLKDMGDFATVNPIYAEYFSQDPPARSTVEVARLPLNASIEVEVIASLPPE